VRNKPAHVSDDHITTTLLEHYGCDVAELTFLPLGYDASAWVYRVEATDRATYFLKVRIGPVNEAGLLVPRALHDAGRAEPIAPLRTLGGALCVRLDGCSLVLYPFVSGSSGMQRGLTPEQWVAYGAALRGVNDLPVTSALATSLPREDFVPVGAADVRAVDAALHDGHAIDTESAEVATYWEERRDLIMLLTERAETLGRRVSGRELPLTLCHADIHTDNVLTVDDGTIRFVDWDEAMLAPRERDLMFVLGGGISRELVTPDHERLFMQGYGPFTADPLALAYYRYSWAAGDVGGFASQVLLRPDLPLADRQEGVVRLKSLFAPGEIVELALAESLE
jgi:spectinomycin phosphotransferase